MEVRVIKKVIVIGLDGLEPKIVAVCSKPASFPTWRG